MSESVKSRILPFVAKYGTRLNFDMNAFNALSDYDLIYALSAKVNEVIPFDNETREMVEEFQKLISEEQIDFENRLTEKFDTGFQATVDTAIGKKIEDGTLGVKNNIVCFGDSFGNEANEWPYKLGLYLRYNVSDYCINGDRWPFSYQLELCEKDYDTPEKKSTIAFGIAYGGVNNVTSTGLVTSTEMYEQFIDDFNTRFPGVRLYICPMSNGNHLYQNNPYHDVYHLAFESALFAYRNLVELDKEFILLPYSDRYAYGVDGGFQPDQLHPNLIGEIAIARRMAAAISGTFSMRAGYYPSAITEGIVLQTDTYFDEKGIHLGRYYCPGIEVANIAFKSLGFCTYENYPLEYIAYSDESTIAGIFRDGKVYINTEKDANQITLSIRNTENYHHIIISDQFIPWGYIIRE